jgi:hypothetical protein
VPDDLNQASNNPTRNHGKSTKKDISNPGTLWKESEKHWQENSKSILPRASGVTARSDNKEQRRQGSFNNICKPSSLQTGRYKVYQPLHPQWLNVSLVAYSTSRDAAALTADVCQDGKCNVYVTPHMVTNSFQERGLPIWEFFCLLARSGTETPRMVMGIGAFAFP